MSVRQRAQARDRGVVADLSLSGLSLADELLGPSPRRSRSHRMLRRVRGAAVVSAGIAALAALVGGGLLLVTPAVGNARELVQALDRHRAADPGSPVPGRLAVALLASQDDHVYAVAGSTGSGGQGGTLSRQLARLLYAGGTGPAAKVEQVVLGLKLDMRYTRAQMFQMYADAAYFGHRIHGLAAASCGYFGEPPAGLSWAQAAMLAWIVQAPVARNPLTDPAMARTGEAQVLGRLVAEHALTSGQASAALGQVIDVGVRPAKSRAGQPAVSSATRTEYAGRSC